MMKSKELLTMVFRSLGITQADGAKAISWSPQQLNGKLARESLRADDLLELLDAVGVDVILSKRDSGEVIEFPKVSYGRRVRCMVNKVKYDTANAKVLANNFYADGVNEYNDGKALELYVDDEGKYFFAEYSSWEGVKDRISPVSSAEAAAFIEKYGTELFREHQ